MKRFFYHKSLFFVLILLSSILATSCDNNGNNGGVTEPSKLPIVINFEEVSLTTDENKVYAPFEVQNIKIWKAPIDMDNNLEFVPLQNPTSENTAELFISKYEKSEEPIWNWTGGIHLVSGGREAVLFDLSTIKDIDKITVVGLDNNSAFFAVAFDGKTIVTKSEVKTGNSSGLVNLHLDIKGRKVSQLYVIGFESMLKKLILE